MLSMPTGLPRWPALRLPRRLPARLLAALVFCSGMLVTQSAASAELASIVVVSPQVDETIHDNTGAVPVAVTLQGTAWASGNRLRALIDGTQAGPDRRALAFTLEGVERGTHTLQVQLLDAKDTLLATSPVVTFHLWQASKFLPPRKPPPPPPAKK